jgi:hypothetical protein
MLKLALVKRVEVICCISMGHSFDLQGCVFDTASHDAVSVSKEITGVTSDN